MMVIRCLILTLVLLIGMFSVLTPAIAQDKSRSDEESKDLQDVIRDVLEMNDRQQLLCTCNTSTPPGHEIRDENGNCYRWHCVSGCQGIGPRGENGNWAKKPCSNSQTIY